MINDESPAVEQLQKDPNSDDGEDAIILPDQEGGEEGGEREEEDEEKDDKLNGSSCPDDSIDGEPHAVAQADSGEQLQTGYQDPTGGDGDDATILPEVSSDAPSAEKWMAVRATSFKEMEQMIATATQSAVATAHDGMLRYSTNDEEIAAERTEDNVLDHSAEVDTAAETKDELLGHSTEAQEVEADDTLTGLQSSGDTQLAAKWFYCVNFPATLSIL